MSRRNLRLLVRAVLIALLAAAPLPEAMGAGACVETHGCVLHVGFVNPCVVDGADVGETLYALGMLGWFAIVTVPFGMLALIVLIVAWIMTAIVNQVRVRNGAAPSC